MSPAMHIIISYLLPSEFFPPLEEQFHLGVQQISIVTTFEFQIGFKPACDPCMVSVLGSVLACTSLMCIVEQPSLKLYKIVGRDRVFSLFKASIFKYLNIYKKAFKHCS